MSQQIPEINSMPGIPGIPSMPGMPGSVENIAPAINSQNLVYPQGQPQVNVPQIEVPMQDFAQAVAPVQQVQQVQQTPVFENVAPAINEAPVAFENVAPVINETPATFVENPQISQIPNEHQMQVEQSLVVQTPVQQELGVVPPVQETQLVTQNNIPSVENLPPVETPMVDMLQNGLDLTLGQSPEDIVKLENASKNVAPLSIGGLTSIGTCNVAGWGGFLKVLTSLTKDLGNEDIVSIENGVLDTNKNGVFIHCDLQQVLGNISLNLIAPQVTTKRLGSIRGGEFVQIFKDTDNGFYQFCNILQGRILTRVKTRFVAESAEGFVKPPVLPGTPYVKEIGAQEQETIRTIIAGKASAESEAPYIFGFSKENNSLVSIGVGSDFTHFFQDYDIPVDEYKVFYPFPVNNIDSAIIKFFKFINPNTQQEECWLHVVSNFDFVSVVCIEKIEKFNKEIEDFKF